MTLNTRRGARSAGAAAALLLTAAIAAPAPALAIDYTQSGTGFPISALPGDPVFRPGDRLVGFVPAGATSVGTRRTQYVTFEGTGAASPGPYRYTFTVDAVDADGQTPSADMFLYDTNTPNGGAVPFLFGTDYTLANPDGLARLRFDAFDRVPGADQTFGFGFAGDTFDPDFSTDYNFTMSWERTLAPVAEVGAVLPGDDFTLLETATESFANWYTFTLAEAGLLTVDTSHPDASLQLDTIMALYGVDGTTLFGDDDGGVGSGSLINVSLPAGTYFLSLGLYSLAAPQAINWNDGDDVPLGWSRDGHGPSASRGNETYQVRFSLGAPAAAVPEPGALGLLAIGMTAAAGSRRVRRARRVESA